ncbi:TlpA family protein disulfide reductase [Parafilimonas sp.]|uniref:TlpA family protein disulfide reductase n=1 Tax=Parafilimonas sp. TaxID=1969739 RepID=UPI003F7E132B
MIASLKFFLTIPFLIIGTCLFAADSAYVKLNFDTSLPLGRFSVVINDGITAYNFKPKNDEYWKGELFSPFGYISIRCINSDTTSAVKNFFFAKGKLDIFIKPAKDEKEIFSIDEKSLENLISYNKMGGDLLDSFISKENKKFWDFYHANRAQFNDSPWLVHQAFLLSDTVNYKKIEFIKKYPDSFMAFWLFESHIVHTETVKPDTLMNLYNTVLTDRYKNSKAGAFIASLIKNKIAITSNANFPDFSVSDIRGNKVESSKLRDKLVLIQFWASWCRPCLEELPVLKELNEEYKDQDFKLISFSIDEDSTAFQKAIEKYSMNWTQIFKGMPLFNSLGGSGVPQLYLIDKSGQVIYNRDTTNDSDLVLLRNILSEHLKNK